MSDDLRGPVGSEHSSGSETVWCFIDYKGQLLKTE